MVQEVLWRLAKINKISDLNFSPHSSLTSVNERKVINKNNVFEVYGLFLSVAYLLWHLKSAGKY